MATLGHLDTILTKLRAVDPDRPEQVCTFLNTIPGSAEAGKFDFDLFFSKGLPLMIEVALEMPKLFEDLQVPIFKMRSSCCGPNLGKRSFTVTRRQCACLLAHSFFGSLHRPKDVQPNDFSFTVSDLFMGTAVLPSSGMIFLNYFTMLGKHSIPDGSLTFDRKGFQKGHTPWKWEQNAKPLCQVEFVVGSIENSPADVHVEFANAFIGGGVMTGDAAMEEILFLVKPELMVAMPLENRMVDEEAICISGVLQYSLSIGYGTSLAFAGDCDKGLDGPTAKICAIDAVRGGSSMERRSLLRDLNKARIAFEGSSEVATGHWGYGAYGNNEDLMFLKQWMAASEAGARKMYYRDHDKKHGHHNLQLERKLQHMNVGQLWELLLSIDPCTVSAFCSWVTCISSGKLTSSIASESNTSSVGSYIIAAKFQENAPPSAQTQTPASSAENKTLSSDPAERSSLEGKMVMFKGVEMTCIKQNGAQVRLQRADGSSTWVSKNDVTLK